MCGSSFFLFIIFPYLSIIFGMFCGFFGLPSASFFRSYFFFFGGVLCFVLRLLLSALFFFFFLAIVFCSAGCKQAFVPKINADIIRSKPFSRSHTQKSSSLLFMGQGNSGSKHSASISRVAPTNTTFQSPLLSEIKPKYIWTSSR